MLPSAASPAGRSNFFKTYLTDQTVVLGLPIAEWSLVVGNTDIPQNNPKVGGVHENLQDSINPTILNSTVKVRVYSLEKAEISAFLPLTSPSRLVKWALLMLRFHPLPLPFPLSLELLE